MLLQPGVSLGGYEVQSTLGAGGMGEVYRARDTRLDRLVALKILPAFFASDPDRVLRFEREAKVLATLNHPFIAQIYGIEESHLEDARISALVMELVDGEDLSQRVARGPIAVDESLEIARQIVDALEAAHEAGIVHRDLKPGNIKVRNDGTVKVLDFGLAKIGETAAMGASSATAAVTSPAMTHAGIILGTAAYMSPEQAKGKTVDKRTDIWAFGCVLFEMLTGTRAFGGDDVTETLTAVMRDTPKWETLPAATPSSVRRLIVRCLERDPRRRLRDIGDARPELDPVISQSPDSRQIAASGGRIWLRRAAWLAAGIAIAMAVLVPMMRLRAPASLPVTRMPLLSASDPQFRQHDAEPGLALTPDGQRVIYQAARSDPDGARIAAGQLLTRALNAFEAMPLPNLGLDPRGPFVSPDGAWVGFETTVGAEVSPVLAKAPLAGGAMVVVSDLARGRETRGSLRGGAWDPAGRIVFATAQFRTGLFEVPASGGTPKAITTPDATKGERGHQWPALLPDNAGILFTIVREDRGLDIAVLPAGAATWKTLLRDGSAARIVTDDYLVYASGDALFAVGFDLRTLSVTTEPVRVIDGVVTKDSGAADFAVAENGSLAYVAGERGQRARRLLWVARDGTTAALPLEARQYQDSQLSRDGRRVAIELFDRGIPGVWIYDLTRDTFTRLTSRDEPATDPTWSPDGRRVAFWNERQRAIVVRSVDGSDAPVVLTRVETGRLYPTEWSPDGKMVAFTQETPNLDLYGVDVTPPHTVRPLATGQGAQVEVDFSPDGKWMTYASFDGQVPEVLVSPVSGSPRRWQVAPAGRHPRWRHDGRAVLYREGNGIYQVAIDAASGMPLGRPTKLMDVPSNAARSGPIEMAADGRFLMLEAVGPGAGRAEIRFVANWVQELRARMATAPRLSR